MVLTGTFVFSTSVGFAFGTCGEVFHPTARNIWHSLNADDPALNRPNFAAMTQNLLAQMSGKTRGPLILSPEPAATSLEVIGSFRTVGDTIYLRFPIIALHVVNSFDRTGRQLSDGQRPRGLNLKMAEFTYAMIAALKIHVKENPELRHVQFKAAELASPSLRALLHKYGFILSQGRSDEMDLNVDLSPR